MYILKKLKKYITYSKIFNIYFLKLIIKIKKTIFHANNSSFNIIYILLYYFQFLYKFLIF